MSDRLTGVDEQVFRSHIAAGPFQSDEDLGWWRLLSIDWPYALIAIQAAERAGAPSEYALRFESSDYPVTPPTAQPWDTERNNSLPSAAWPNGKSRVSLAFNPSWKGG